MKFTLALLLFVLPIFGQNTWRQATAKELASLVPDRAKVEKENIETELRTASGITNGKGKFAYGVVLITAGYAADGKYAQSFVTQFKLKIGDFTLTPGDYVFGHKRVDQDSLEVKFYEAATGKFIGTVKAVRKSKSGAIRSLLITSPENDKGMIQIGRFGFDYQLEK